MISGSPGSRFKRTHKVEPELKLSVYPLTSPPHSHERFAADRATALITPKGLAVALSTFLQIAANHCGIWVPAIALFASSGIAQRRCVSSVLIWIVEAEE
jgi:hypothetical protein